MGALAGAAQGGPEGPWPDPHEQVADPKRLDALRRLGLLDAGPDEAFDRLTRLASRFTGAPVALVSLVDEDRQFFLSHIGLPEPWATQRETPLTHSVCQYAVGQARPIVIPDLLAEPGFEQHPAITDLSVVAYLGVPLTLENGHVIGSFCVIDDSPHKWTEADVAVVRDLAGSVMTEIALREYAHRIDELVESEHRARLRSELLAEIGRQLPSAVTVAERAQMLADLLVPSLADRAAVEVAPGERHSDPALAREARGQGPPGGERVVERWESGAEPGGSSDGTHVLQIPFTVGDGRAGLLLLKRDRSEFSKEERVFAVEIARRAGAGLTVAHLWEDEHRTALRLQRALLPAAVVAPAGLEVVARYEASTTTLEVGGDWYDTVLLSDGRLGLTVGDVVGHGLEAAAAMGRLRTALHALAPHTPRPGLVLDRLDEFACGPNGSRFATATYVVVDPLHRRAAYASAGHPPMLLLPPDGTSQWLRDGLSPPLYGSVSPGRGDATVDLEPGSLLLLYSDGLIERRGESLDIGLERLLTAARRYRHLPLDRLCDHVLADTRPHDQRKDDAVLLALRLSTPPDDSLPSGPAR